MFGKAIFVGVTFLLVSACQTATERSFKSVETFASPDNVLGEPREVQVSGSLQKPDGLGPYPAIILLHTCGGVRSHVSHDWPQYLNNLGYVTLTIDSYSARGVSNCTKLPTYGGYWYLVQAYDAYGALEYLNKLPFVDINRTAVMGFSAGAIAINGGIVTKIAKSPSNKIEFKAAVALYGRCSDLNKATWIVKNNLLPVLEIAAEHDIRHAPSCVEAAKSYRRIKTHVIKGAHHSFDESDLRIGVDSFGNIMKFSSKARNEARELTKQFLKQHLTP